MPYNAEARDRPPLNANLDQQCHCLDGGFPAALLLWKIGFPLLVLDFVPAPALDDDHILVLYQVEERWDATAKSNFVQPGFRELAMTYFEHYIVQPFREPPACAGRQPKNSPLRHRATESFPVIFLFSESVS